MHQNLPYKFCLEICLLALYDLWPKSLMQIPKCYPSSVQKWSVRRVPENQVLIKLFTKLAGKHQCWSFFFNRVVDGGLQLYLKRNLDAGVFLLILRNFLEHLSYKTYSNSCFCQFFVNKFFFLRL